MGLALADIGVIVAYFASMLAIGILSERLAMRGLDEYVLAGRRLGYLLFVPAMASVVLGGACTIGTARLGYQFGVSGAWLPIMISLGVVACGLVVAKRIVALRIYTMSEFLGNRYSPATRRIGAVVTAMYTLMIYVVQTIAVGTVMSVILGVSFEMGTLIGGLIVVAYTVLGGMWSVTLTDLLQWIFMTLGVIVFLPLFGYLAVVQRGLSLASLPAEYWSPVNIGYERMLSYFMLYFFGLMLGQDIWQRVLTAKNEKVSSRGTVLAGVYGVIYAIAAAFVGMLAYVYFQGGLENPRLAMPIFAAEALPAGLAGLTIAAMLAAFMSTADGTLIATSTLIAYDIIAPLKKLPEKKIIRWTAVLNLVFGLLGIYIAIYIQELLVALDIAYLILSASLFIPTVIGLYWTKPQAKAAIAAIVTSLVVSFGYALYLGWPDGFADVKPIATGLLVCAVIYALGAKLWPPKTVQKQ